MMNETGTVTSHQVSSKESIPSTKTKITEIAHIILLEQNEENKIKLNKTYF